MFKTNIKQKTDEEFNPMDSDDDLGPEYDHDDSETWDEDEDFDYYSASGEVPSWEELDEEERAERENSKMDLRERLDLLEEELQEIKYELEVI